MRMNNIVEIQVTTEKIIFKISRFNIIEEIDNMVFFTPESEKPLLNDIAQGKFKSEYPIRYKDSKPFRPFFDVQIFDSEVAALFLWNWFKFGIPELIGINILGFLIKPEVTILFDGYEDISLERQKEFEYLIFRYLGTGKLNINGIDKRKDKGSDFPVQILMF